MDISNEKTILQDVINVAPYIPLFIDEPAEENILFSIMAEAFSANGQSIDLGSKDLKWFSSDTRVATVKSDSYMAIGNVTIKAKSDGACIITAVTTDLSEIEAIEWTENTTHILKRQETNGLTTATPTT